MKKTLALILLTFSISLVAQEGCKITGNFEKSQTGKITIYPYQQVQTREKAEELTITSTIENGTLDLTLDTLHIRRTGVLQLGDKNYHFTFFTENHPIQFSIDTDELIITGGPVNEKYQQFAEDVNLKEIQRIKYSRKEEDRTTLEAYRQKLLNMAKKEPENLVLAAYLFDEYYGANEEKLSEIISTFDPSVLSNYYLADLIRRRDAMLNTKVGTSIIPFEITNDDLTFSINSYKGKYVIIDFWASWCGPCRKAIPSLKELYSKYNPQGLEIVSISIDSELDKWKQAVKEEQMPWIQLHDNIDLSEAYNISAIPYLIIINEEGKIVAKGHFSEENLILALEKYGFKQS